MKFPSSEFDDAVASACHGTVDEATIAAIGELLQTDDDALDEYLLRTELHATLLTSRHLLDPVKLSEIEQLTVRSLLESRLLEPGLLDGPESVTAMSNRRGMLAAAWAGVAVLGVMISVTLWSAIGSVGGPQDSRSPGAGSPNAATASSQAAVVIGSFGTIDDAQWIAANTLFRAGDPLRSGQRIELASGSVRLHFASGAVVQLSGPAIFETESALSGTLTMGRVTVTADTPESKGFTIRTRTGRIVDLGTEFVAEALPDGRCRIGVSSGAVRFHAGDLATGRLLQAGDLMEIEPGHRQVITRIERGDESPQFRFPTIEPPSAEDLADASLGRASICCVRGRLYENPNVSFVSPGPEILRDGKGQSLADSPRESLHFANDQTGGILIDLGASAQITKINIYSWHRCLNPGFPPPIREAHRERAAQKYVLYGSAANEPPKVDDDPAKNGWTLVARVNSDEYFGLVGVRRPAQQASSITSARGTIGSFRHLLFVVQPTAGTDDDGSRQNFSTLFGEIDVYAE